MRASVAEVAIISRLDSTVDGKPVKEFKDILSVCLYRYCNHAMPFAPSGYLDVNVTSVASFLCGLNGVTIEADAQQSRVALYTHLRGDFAGSLYCDAVIDRRDMIVDYPETRRLVIQAADPSISDAVLECLCGPPNEVSRHCRIASSIPSS